MSVAHVDVSAGKVEYQIILTKGAKAILETSIVFSIYICDPLLVGLGCYVCLVSTPPIVIGHRDFETYPFKKI